MAKESLDGRLDITVRRVDREKPEEEVEDGDSFKPDADRKEDEL